MLKEYFTEHWPLNIDFLYFILLSLSSLKEFCCHVTLLSVCWHSSGVLVLTLTGWLVDVFGVPSPVSHVLNCILVTSPVTAPAPTQSCSLWRSVWCVYQYHSNNIPPTTASLYLPVECQIIMTTQITSYNQSSCPISWLLTDSQKSEYLNVSFYMEPKKRSGWCKSFFRKLFFTASGLILHFR